MLCCCLYINVYIKNAAEIKIKKAVANITLLFFFLFCNVYLEIPKPHRVFATVLFSLSSLKLQLTPNCHEDGKENCRPIIKKVGDLRSIKKDHNIS